MTPKVYERVRKPLVAVSWSYVVYMAYMLLHPIPPVPPPVRYVFSFVHFLAFAALGGLVGMARLRMPYLAWLVPLLIWGVASEVLQPLTGRFFEYRDIFQNELGVTVGLAAAYYLRRFLVREERGPEEGEARS